MFLLPGAQTAEAVTYSVECNTSPSLSGRWHVYSKGIGDRTIPCDMNKPGWNFDFRPGAQLGDIRWVYTQANPPPPVDQAVASVTHLVPDDADHRVVRGTDGQCYREERGERGWPRGWHRSRPYGSTDRACRNAAWNAHYRAHHLNMVDPDGGTFPTRALPTVPEFESASAYGTTLVLTFDQDLKPAFTPAPGAFHVTVNNARRNVAAGGVSIRARTVTLTLESAVAGGDTVRVRYTRPSSGYRLQATSHLAVDSFGDQEVGNLTILVPADGIYWSAELTVGDLGFYYGCNDGTASNPCTTGLTDNTFEFDGVQYQVTAAQSFRPSSTQPTSVELTLDKAWPALLRTTAKFHFDNTPLLLADASFLSQEATASWTAGSNVARFGGTILLRLTTGDVEASGNAPGPSVLSGPSPQGSSVQGSQLQVKFDEPLDESAPPPGDSFTVKMTPDGAPPDGGSGARMQMATRDGPGLTVAGTGTARVSGATVTVQLGTAVPPGWKVAVSYAPPEADALRARSGAEAAAFSGEPATNDPGPSFRSATVSGSELRVRFDKALDEDAAPPGRRFTVQVRRPPGAGGGATGGPPSTGPSFGGISWPDLTGGGTIGTGAPRTVAGTGTASVSGKAVTVTLPEAIAPGAAVTVSYAPPGGANALRDLAGTRAAAFSLQRATVVAPQTVSAPPGAPTGVTVSGASAPGLSVSWTAPSDTGSAAVAGYELRWYAGEADPADAAAWTETGEVGAGTTATIADLSADTAYRVQVRARGAGKGPWSESGAGRTGAAPLTASFVGMPAEHDGKTPFTFELRFSEDFPGRLRFKLLRDEAFRVTNGRVMRAKRVEQGQNQRWTITVQPASPADVVVRLPAAVNCALPGQVCTEAGRKLSSTVTETVHGPVYVSVADARAREGIDAAMEFPVSLSRAASQEVTVRYATADGTAVAGEDYTAAKGTLTFAAGESEKTVRVAVLDDAVDEGSEMFVLWLSNVSGARFQDRAAIGTITNDDPLQKMWLSRFGRTVADHVTGAVADRLAGPLSGAQVTVGGHSVDLAQAAEDEKWLGEALTAVARALGASGAPPAGDGAGPGSHASGFGAGPGSRSGTGLGLRGSAADAGTPGRVPGGRELLLGSAFHLATDGERSGPGLAAWGRVTLGGFDGEAPADGGDVRIDGSVTTGILGADAEWNRLLAGVAISVSEGEGTFAQPGVDKGSVESTMTTVSPYARFMVNDRVSVWGLAGWGTGDMTIVQDARTAADGQPARPERISRTDLEMRLAALGGRGALLQADETGGIDLGLRADAFWVETESNPISNEGRTTANASRVRLALEGSRAFRVGGGTFTPGLELGLRHDGGDAETGTGVELGGRIAYEDPETGLGVEARARTLIAHEDSDYREWGASGAVRLAPGERGRGLSFSLSPTWGAASSGVDRLWGARDARGLAPNGEFEAGQSLQGELGYGLGLFGDRFTGTPNLGFGLSDNAREYRIGWRLNSVVRGDPGFEVNLDATRREAVNDNAPPEHGVMLRGAIRW